MIKECRYSLRLTRKLRFLDKKKDLDFGLINKAIFWAKKYHNGQYRKNGEHFYSHPIEVAYMISEYVVKTDVIVASILHDIVEDTEVTLRMLLDEFGYRIAQIVDRLTRIRPDGEKFSVERILTDSYAKKDIEVLLIKFMDRIHNLSTMGFYSIEQKRKKRLSSLIEFLPISLEIEDYKSFEKILYLCKGEKYNNNKLCESNIDPTFM